MRRRSPLDDEICTKPGACWCWRCVLEFCAEHPDGATCDLVAAAIGTSRQRVDQITRGALRKLRDR